MYICKSQGQHASACVCVIDALKHLCNVKKYKCSNHTYMSTYVHIFDKCTYLFNLYIISGKCPLCVFDVSKYATKQQLRRVVMAKIRTNHPDKNSSQDATVITQQLNKANKFLQDLTKMAGHFGICQMIVEGNLCLMDEVSDHLLLSHILSDLHVHICE